MSIRPIKNDTIEFDIARVLTRRTVWDVRYNVFTITRLRYSQTSAGSEMSPAGVGGGTFGAPLYEGEARLQYPHLHHTHSPTHDKQEHYHYPQEQGKSINSYWYWVPCLVSIYLPSTTSAVYVCQIHCST